MAQDRPSPEPAEQIQAATTGDLPGEVINHDPGPETRATGGRTLTGNHDSASQGVDAASPQSEQAAPGER